MPANADARSPPHGEALLEPAAPPESSPHLRVRAIRPASARHLLAPSSDFDPSSEWRHSRVSLRTLITGIERDAAEPPVQPDPEDDDLSDAGAGVTHRGFNDRRLGPEPRQARAGVLARLVHYFSRPGLAARDAPPPSASHFGDGRKPLTVWERRRIVLKVGLTFMTIFVLCSILLASTLWVFLPPLDPEDRPLFQLPRSFEQLLDLHTLVIKHKEKYSGRLLVCWTTTFVFLQTFAIPGSMWMAILAGAVWGTPVAYPLVVASVTCGATIAYFISKPMGSLLLVRPRWKLRVDSWKSRIQEEEHLISYLVLLRMAPVPPHSVINIASPHLGVSLIPFWISTAAGTAAISFIQVTVGEKLEEMTTPDEIQFFSPHNLLLLAGVILAAILPLAVRKTCTVTPLEEDEATAGPLGQIALPPDPDVLVEGRIALTADDDVEALAQANPGYNSPRLEEAPLPRFVLVPPDDGNV